MTNKKNEEEDLTRADSQCDPTPSRTASTGAPESSAGAGDGHALIRERARRRFMSVTGRHLSWGRVGPYLKQGVQFTSEGCQYQRQFDCWELYEDHGNDRERAECAVIDKAMASMPDDFRSLTEVGLPPLPAPPETT